MNDLAPKHEPILWVYNEIRGRIETVSGYAVEPRGLTGRRMVEDHNTLANIPDPAATLATVREALKALIPHVMQYAAMPHAHSDAHQDAANARAALARLPEG